jgi:hypothetical protein
MLEYREEPFLAILIEKKRENWKRKSQSCS